MANNNFVFYTDCTSASGAAIQAMVDKAVQITPGTFRRHLAEGQYRLLETRLGYKGSGLHLHSDWAVSFWKSTYLGAPCYYVDWSRIEQVFIQPADMEKVIHQSRRVYGRRKRC